MDLLTTDEVAAILRLSPQTLRVWRHRKKGPPWRRLEGSIRYPREGVDEWVAGSEGPETGGEGA